jgi:Asp-tRNA(Asn)/Glu-tRNA(Gln) amidotransferase A subunit family amidase
MDGHAGIGSPPAWRLFATVGPLARSVSDLDLGLRAMASQPLGPPEPGPFRVAVYEDDGLQPVARACRAAVRRAAAALADSGHEKVETVPAAAAEARALFGVMVGAELGQYLPELVEGREAELSRYGRDFVDVGRTMEKLDLRAYLDAGRRLNELETEADAWLVGIRLRSAR